ncbi:ABC transporter substrate-binding protein [Streptomyces fragilis]|uniref:ABC transporter substrate-binding protein n=1 Tax=Streptomyces fragilis TaxID=67301 RepID=A0ABV2YJK9_9ACTN|nr:ABC transporter substrate-binding protein [Streptomyces fragilis]
MRRLLAGMTAGALLLSATACGSSVGSASGKGSSARGVTTVRVGVVPVVDVAPLYLGREKGIFERHGLDLEMTPAQGGAAIVPGVVGEQFQFGFSNMASLMIAHSGGVPVKAVVNGVATTGEKGRDFGALVVKGDSGISSAKDLEGRKVAVNTLKNINDTTVRESVRQAGGDPSAVTFVEIAFERMPAALASGRIDGAMAVEPALSTAKSQGAKEVASSYVDVSDRLTVAMYFTSARYAQRNPEVVERFAAATEEALTYADGHPDEVRDVLTTYTGIPAELLPKLVLPRWPAEADRASIETLRDLGEKDGLYARTPDLDALLP